MKTLGIIGGIGPESTIEYYRHLIALHRERTADGSYPPVLINSIDLSRMLALVGAGEYGALTAFLVGHVQKLAWAGADVGLIAANTPHVVFDEVRRQSAIPLISIVEATRDEARALGLTRLGLIGSRFTMEGRFYPDVFSAAGMTVVVPNPKEQAHIHEKYMHELVNGVVRAETRDGLLAIVGRLREREGIDGLILGGTELTLILREPPVGGPVLLDTAKIHVKHALAQVSL
jgi:aspartate racemase